MYVARFVMCLNIYRRVLEAKRGANALIQSIPIFPNTPITLILILMDLFQYCAYLINYSRYLLIS